MHNIINTGKFFFQHQFNISFPVDTTRYRDTRSGKEYLIYRPVVKNRTVNTYKKVILAFHGMTMLGSEDPKFIRVCSSLSGCGYTVIAPQIDSMQNLLIDPSDISGIVEIISSITQNRELCPEGKLSVFAASFAGGICLMASSREEIAGKINSICLIGTFANIETSIHYLLGNQQSDNYGRMIILKNFLEYSMEVPEAIYKVLDAAISDNFFKREIPELQSCLRGLSLKEYDIAIRLLNDPDYRIYHWERIRKNHKFEEILSRFSMDKYVKKLRASILVIHGIDDDVIPPEESINLFRNLKKIKVRSRLILTPLMGHSDLKMNINLLPSVLELFTGMSFFFKSI